MLRGKLFSWNLSLSHHDIWLLTVRECVSVCRAGSRQSCWKRRTSLEKSLTIIVILTACLLALAVVILAVSFATGSYSTNTH